MHYRRRELVAFAGDLPQDRQVDVGELVDIDAPRAAPVFSEFGQERLCCLPVGQPVKNQVGLPWRKTDRARVAFVARGVTVVVVPEAHDRGSPHGGLLACDVLQKIQQDFCIGSSDGVVDSRDEFSRIDVCGAEYLVSHESSMPCRQLGIALSVRGRFALTGS